jgi:hypothetical protein
MSRLLDARLMLVIGCLLLLAAYWVGLRGGFLLDDQENFAQLERLARGEVTWLGPIVSNASGPLGRPLSMASFVATVSAGGHVPWAYKVGNLFLHVSIGALMALLAMLCLRRDASLGPRAPGIAVLLGVLWMALPIHVSTVLYPVQRMAQLSTLFLVAGLIAYITLRERLVAAPESRGAALALLGSIIGFTALGALSKENGLLLPLLCLALEMTLFANEPRGRAAARNSLILTLAVPAMLGAIALIVFHERLLGAYAIRNFTMLERLLTQPRVLWDYVFNVLLPAGPRLGVYQDDFTISRALWHPWTTLPALLGWLILLSAAARWRRQAPVFAAGLFVFLGGHAMEAGIFPLEIYFEHRNYFPSIGLLLMLAGIMPVLAGRLGAITPAFRRLAAAAPVVLALVMLGAVHARALVWASPELLMAQSQKNRPDSPRVQSTLAARAMEEGALGTALAHLDTLERLSGPIEQGSTAIWRVVAHCVTGHAVPEELVAAVRTTVQPRPTVFGLRAGIILSEQIEAGRCNGPTLAEWSNLYRGWVERLEVNPRSLAGWRLRLIAARLAAAAQDWPTALTLGRAAWADSGWNPGAGIFVVQVANSIGDIDQSSQLVDQLAETAPAWDLRVQEAISSFRKHVDEERRRDAAALHSS